MGWMRCLAFTGRSEARLAARLAVLGAACIQSGSQAPPHAEGKDGSLKVNVPLVQFDAEVFDKKTGRVTDGLTKDNFEVEEDGRREHVAGVSRDQVPLSIVLLMDETDTVRPVIAKLARGAEVALGHLRAEDEIAVMTYASSTQVAQGFTLSHEAATAAIERASRVIDNSPAFYNEAVYDGCQLLAARGRPDNRKVIIWLTDNVPNMQNGRVHTAQEAYKQAYAAGVVIMAIVERSGLSDVFAVINKNPITATMHRHDPAGDVTEYVNRTGGDVLKANADEVSDRLADIIDRLRLRYRISYYSGAREPERRLHPVKVTVQQNGRRLKSLLVRAPSGYYR